jgi:hypothetical protein
MCKKSRDETTRLKSTFVAEVSGGLKREENDHEREREIVRSLSLCGNMSLKSSCCDVPLSLCDMNAVDGAANGAPISARVHSPDESESSSSPSPLSPVNVASDALSVDAALSLGAALSLDAAEVVVDAPARPLSSGFSRFFETAKERCFYQEIPQKKAGFKTIFMERESNKAEKIVSDPTNVMVIHSPLYFFCYCLLLLFCLADDCFAQFLLFHPGSSFLRSGTVLLCLRQGKRARRSGRHAARAVQPIHSHRTRYIHIYLTEN